MSREARQGAFNAKRLNASKSPTSPSAEPLERRCACGALACFGWGLGEAIWYCGRCVPEAFWDNKRRAEGEAVAAAPRPAGPPARQGSLKL